MNVAGGQLVQVTPLVIFNGTNGQQASATLTAGPNGDFYGVTQLGGTNANGTVYKLNTNGTFASLFSFGPLVANALGVGTNDTGVGPSVPLTLGPDGNLYGLSRSGGTNGDGTIFKITTNGSFTTLIHFTGTSGPNPGSSPVGTTALTLGLDGNFYGTTRFGGTNIVGSVKAGTNGCGTLFRLTLSGAFTTLVNFSGTNGIAPGAAPSGRLVQGTDGNFYGTTRYGGTNDQGTLFKMTTNGTLTSLVSFEPLFTDTNLPVANSGTNDTGAQPVASLTQTPDGTFYGTTPIGGANANGTVFKFTTSGGFIKLYTFSAVYPGSTRPTNYDGAQVSADLVPGPGGVFYTTPSNGGEFGAGTIVTITTNGTLTTLYSFSPLVANKNAEGGDPFGVTFGSDGDLYGDCFIGGANGDGSVYRVIPGRLNIQWLAGKAVLSWTNSAYALQSAPVVTGTYTNIPGATSPYTNSLPAAQQFFRLVNP
jgi:uncharacterized repeat protein (TIGR03803 family)